MEFEIKSLTDIGLACQAMLDKFDQPKVFAFIGEMGAGKTTFITSILNSMGIEETEGSPTYSLVNVYESKMFGKIYHFDLYRLKDEGEAFDIGIEEMIYSGAWCFIEWPEIITEYLPEETIWVYIRKMVDNSRLISIKDDN